MKRILFIGPYSHHLNSRSSLACYRIVRWLCANVPGCELIQYEDYVKSDCHKNVDAIVYFYSSFYAKFDEIITFMKKHPHSKTYWLYNEYTLALNSSIAKYFYKRGYEVITNLMDGHSKDIVNSAKKINVINVNVTAFRDEIVKRPFHERDIDLMYYGSYRPDRQEYMNEYYQNAIVSTSSKNVKRFQANGLNAKFVDRLIWARKDSTLNKVKFSVYVEDKSMHLDKFSSLSDRFYECISNGVVLFFDINCKKNVSASGYNIEDYFFVSNKNELNQKMLEIESDLSIRDRYFDNVLSGIEAEKESLRQNFMNIFKEVV
ncbi:hypothetical protein UFOVP410_32 [uncultured Caudovirales phage]|uniref:Glycosyl transferases group 1 n=1 Tax=uncultured Caudovirales phage TaxID=2100421 RepID=A0A6J5M6W7_9CAUD|nr:hypothetical protein UFOVP410_32 [uncultured Caudovirales phage]